MPGKLKIRGATHPVFGKVEIVDQLIEPKGYYDRHVRVKISCDGVTNWFDAISPKEARDFELVLYPVVPENPVTCQMVTLRVRKGPEKGAEPVAWRMSYDPRR
jgi:hypothetical protein